MILPQTAKFIRDNANLMVTGDHKFDEMFEKYRRLCGSATGLSLAFIELGFNPLEYLHYVPEAYRLEDRSIEEEIIPDNITEIHDGAYVGCTYLKEINIPDSVTFIGESVFQDCTSLLHVRLPNKIDHINSYLFCGCHSLEAVYIPKGVRSIFEDAFYDCRNLEHIYFGGTLSEWGKIPKDTDIKRGVTVHCTDGNTVTK